MKHVTDDEVAVAVSQSRSNLQVLLLIEIAEQLNQISKSLYFLSSSGIAIKK